MGEIDESYGFWGFVEPVLANPAEIEGGHFGGNSGFRGREKNPRKWECENRVLGQREPERRRCEIRVLRD